MCCLNWCRCGKDLVEQHPLLPFHIICALCRLASIVLLSLGLWFLLAGWGFRLELGTAPPLGYEAIHPSGLSPSDLSDLPAFPIAHWANASLPPHMKSRLLGQYAATMGLGFALAYAVFLIVHGLVACLLHKLRWEIFVRNSGQGVQLTDGVEGLVTPLVGIYVLIPCGAIQMWFSSCLWIPVHEGAQLDSHSGHCHIHSWLITGIFCIVVAILFVIDGLVWTAGIMEGYWEYMYLTPPQYKQYMALQIAGKDQGRDYRAEYVERRDIGGEIVVELFVNARRKRAPKTSCFHPTTFPILKWRFVILTLVNMSTALVGWGQGFCQHLVGIHWLNYLKCDLANEFASPGGGLPLWSWGAAAGAGLAPMAGQAGVFALLVVVCASYVALIAFAAIECCKIRLFTRMAPPMTFCAFLVMGSAAVVEGWMGSGAWMDRASLHWRQPFFDTISGVFPIVADDYPETWGVILTWIFAAIFALIATPLILVDFGISWLIWRDYKAKKKYVDELAEDKTLSNRAEGKGAAVGALTGLDVEGAKEELKGEVEASFVNRSTAPASLAPASLNTYAAPE